MIKVINGEPVEVRGTFEEELTCLINRFSKENGSNTPDFILAEYLTGCLTVFNNAVNGRNIWYRTIPQESKGPGNLEKEKD